MTAEFAGEIVVVPHTHWDREWYEPFQRFRLRLVALMDEVLDTMEREPGYHFTLDGQLACVDDYLEVRPENRDRVAALVESGRLAVGPWQILLDEFLCSGENIVRNLELGMARADKLGGAMPVGYLPDMFGHTAQMPQILRRAGLPYACVYRGVPSSVTTDAFAWVAPPTAPRSAPSTCPRAATATAPTCSRTPIGSSSAAPPSSGPCAAGTGPTGRCWPCTAPTIRPRCAACPRWWPGSAPAWTPCPATSPRTRPTWKGCPGWWVSCARTRGPTSCPASSPYART
ncbi:hypothetical protein ACFSTC_45220 [Nonomuraea ferruginea]